MADSENSDVSRETELPPCQWREGPPITQRETPDGIEVRVPGEVQLTTPMWSARITGLQEPSK